MYTCTCTSRVTCTCHMDVIRMSHERHRHVTWMSYTCHMDITHVTWMSHACHMDVTGMSHGHHTHVTSTSHTSHGYNVIHITYTQLCFKPLTALHSNIPSTVLPCHRNMIAVHQLVLPAMAGCHIEDTITIRATKPERGRERSVCVCVCVVCVCVQTVQLPTPSIAIGMKCP